MEFVGNSRIQGAEGIGSHHGDDRQAAAFFDIAGCAEQALGLVDGAGGQTPLQHARILRRGIAVSAA